MRFARFISGDRTIVGIKVDGGYADTGYSSMDELIRDGDDGLSQAADRAACGDTLAVDRLLAPIVPARTFGTGINFSTHSTEDPRWVDPGEPIVNFIKTPNAVIGDGDAIELPASGAIQRPDGFRVTWEAELLAVIGKRAKNVSAVDADSYIFGYTLINDVTALGMVFTNSQMMLGKTPDTFSPIGPEILTPDELGDYRTLDLRCEVNGTQVQSATMADQIHSPARLVEWISALITLEPGEAISTGTPNGIAMYLPGEPYLQPGDTVTVSSSRIGSLTNSVV